MSDDEKTDNTKFRENLQDFGKEPTDFPLDPNQKKLAAIAMGVQAAIIQFILEGLIPLSEQLHFMTHLQDFTARIYSGESLKFDGTGQTLQINSKAGTLFYQAAEEALENGHKNYEKLKEMTKAVNEQNAEANLTEQDNHVSTKPTLH